jgi:hypothetical protein
VSVSKEGKVLSINNLLKANDIFFLAAHDAINNYDGKWVIKPGIDIQTFQTTFYMIFEEMDILRRSGKLVVDVQKPLRLNIDYNSEPVELTLLPTIRLIYKQANLPISTVE